MAQFSSAQPDSSAAKAARSCSWPTWLGRAFALLLLAAACIGAYWLGGWQPTPAEELLYVDPKYLDFGEVWENPKFEWVLPIENRTSEGVSIVGFVSSCESLRVEPSSLVVPGMGQATVKLTFDAGGLAAQSGCGASHAGEPGSRRPSDTRVRDVRIQLAPRVRSGCFQHAPWTLRGRVRQAFVLSTYRLAFFNETLVRGQPFAQAQVGVIAETSLTKVTAQCDRGLASVEVTGMGDRYLLTITPSESLRAGPFRGDVTVEGLTTGGEVAKSKVNLEGLVLDDIQAVPATIAFAASTVGQHLEETLVLTSLSADKFQVLAIECSSQDLKVEPVTEHTVTDKMFRVVQLVSQPGHQSNTIRFKVSASQPSGSLDVFVPVLSHGLPNAQAR